MKTRIQSILVLLFLLVGLLTACSSLSLTGAGSETTTTESQNAPLDDFGGQPLETRLALGTLALEGSDLAVTTAQAADLLPLWKAVKTLSASDTASPEEVSALYTQISETMSAEQVAAIEAQELTREEMSALMEQYGIELPQNPTSDLSEDERATRVAQFQGQREQGGGQGFAGGPPAGGFPGGAPPEGGFQGRRGAMQGTPQPGQEGRAMRGGANLMFVDPLIQLLTERAGQ